MENGLDLFGQAVRLLGESLDAFLTSALTSVVASDGDWTRILAAHDAQKPQKMAANDDYNKVDSAVSLRVFIDRPEKVREPLLRAVGKPWRSRLVSAYALELKAWRNDWAHNEPLVTDEDWVRALDTMERLLVCINRTEHIARIQSARHRLERGIVGPAAPQPVVDQTAPLAHELAMAPSSPTAHSGIVPADGHVVSAAVGSRGRGHQELFVALADGTVLQRWWEGSSWGEWVVFAEGMPLVHLAVSSLEHSHLEVFGVRKGAGGLVHRWYDETTGWGGWNTMALPASHADIPVASLALGSRGRGHQELFVALADGTVLQRWWEGSSWGEWVVFAEGMPLVHLAVSSLEHSHLEVFGVRKGAGGLVHRWYDETTGWGGWSNMGVTLASFVDRRQIDPDTGRVYDPSTNQNLSGIHATDGRRRKTRPRGNTRSVRVHELAKELKLSSKQILKQLEDQGEGAKSASSTISGASASRVREYFRRTPPR